jgi:Calcineurin-like phosphoesterase
MPNVTRRQFQSACLATLSVLLTARVSAQANDARPLEFAFIGDTPYNESEAFQLGKVLDDIGQSRAQFIIHAGDFKSGVEVCSDTFLEQRLNLLTQTKPPLFLTLGDNEWLDCHRLRAGGYSPQERLEFLRRKAFARDQSLGKQPLALVSQRQGGHPENQRWVAHSRGKPVMFASMNIPGSRNGTDGSESPERIALRMAANYAWLSEAIDQAKQTGAKLLVLSTHADPGFGHRAPNAYTPWLTAVSAHARAFDGHILYLHGDSHLFRHDQPLEDVHGWVPNLTRIECYGSPFSTLWLTVKLDATAKTSAQMIQVTTQRLYGQPGNYSN